MSKKNSNRKKILTAAAVLASAGAVYGGYQMLKGRSTRSPNHRNFPSSNQSTQSKGGAIVLVGNRQPPQPGRDRTIKEKLLSLTRLSSGRPPKAKSGERKPQRYRYVNKNLKPDHLFYHRRRLYDFSRSRRILVGKKTLR